MWCCCCFDQPRTQTSKEPGIVEQRRCRDVLWLLLFVVFWIGMGVVCVFGFMKGDLDRLVYGYDSYGFLCGTDNSGDLNGEGPDLRDSKKLYYLDPLELLEPANFKSAKRICVKECPSVKDVCDLTTGDHPTCNDSRQFRCPYYRLAERGIYDHLNDVNPWSTSYYTQLSTFVDAERTCSLDFAQQVLSSVDSDGSICGQQFQAESLIPDTGPCYPVWTETTDYFNRCFPEFDEALQSFITASRGEDSETDTFSVMKDEFGGIGERLKRYVADITKGWMIIIVGGLCTALITSLIWLLILRYCATIMAWTTIVAVNLACIGCTVFSVARAGHLGEMGAVGASLSERIPEDEDPTEREREIWFYVSIGAGVISLLLMLLTLVMIPRIRIAIAIIKVACSAIKSMPMLLFFPLLPFLIEVALVVYFVFVSVMLYSAGDLVPKFRNTPEVTTIDLYNFFDVLPPESEPEADIESPPKDPTREECAQDPSCYYDVEWNRHSMYMFLYHLFGLLWTNQFIVGLSYLVISGAVANFYWCRGDSQSMNQAPIRRSIWRTIRYHLGSIALGSFFIAVVQFIRPILEYISRKTKRMQERGNAAVRYIMCCLGGFLWLLEQIIQFINRNAYIMVAVKGTGYCRSAGRAVSLLISNALRLVAVNVIGDVLLWLGKLTVTASCGVIAFVLSDFEIYTNDDKYPETYLSSPLMPVLVSLLVGYVVADLFFEVFEMTIDTVLLSFCEDCETHDGQAKFAPALLMTAIGKSKRFHEQIGDNDVK